MAERKHIASSIPSLWSIGNSFKYFYLSQIIWETWDFDMIMDSFVLNIITLLSVSVGHAVTIFWCFCALNLEMTFLTIENTSSSILLVFAALSSHLPPVMQNKIALAITVCQIKPLVSWWPVSYFLESGKQFFPKQVGENDRMMTT